jgi:hypothetical protein
MTGAAASASDGRPSGTRVASVQTERAHAAPVVWLSPLARGRLVFVAVAAAMIVAGGFVAAVNGASSFAHGSWLAAYLVLVGGVSQLLLGVGSLALPEPTESIALTRAQVGLWNAGTLAVAGGVLADLFGVVLGGSALIVGALACFARGGGPVREPRPTAVLAYRFLIVVLVISVVVGGVLSRTGPAG